MMADTYFKRCSEAVEEANGEGYWCRCHGCDPYLPVPMGALLIEDGFDAAVGRMMEVAHDQGDDGWYRLLLRAAAGEGER